MKMAPDAPNCDGFACTNEFDPVTAVKMISSPGLRRELYTKVGPANPGMPRVEMSRTPVIVCPVENATSKTLPGIPGSGPGMRNARAIATGGPRDDLYAGQEHRGSAR